MNERNDNALELSHLDNFKKDRLQFAFKLAQHLANSLTDAQVKTVYDLFCEYDKQRNDPISATNLFDKDLCEMYDELGQYTILPLLLVYTSPISRFIIDTQGHQIELIDYMLNQNNINRLSDPMRDIITTIFNA